MFAKVIALLDGPEAAQSLLEKARADANKGRRSDFQHGARAEAIGTEAEIGLVDSALEKARKLRSPRERCFTVATLLAESGKWTELPAVCSAVTSPVDAAEVCLRVTHVIRNPR